MIKFELTKDFIGELNERIENKDQKSIIAMITDCHPADIAEILDELEFENACFLFELLEDNIAADVLVELEDDLREELLKIHSPKEIAEEFVDNMDSDDAADIISELPENKKQEVLSHLEDQDLANDIVDLLNYDEDTAGGLMAKELVKIEENLSVLKCLNVMRAQAEEVTRVHSIYVVDSKNRLKGRLSLKDLITANSKAKVKDIFIPKVDFVTVDQKGEEVARIMSKYDLEAIPVVNKKNQLLGRITIDDILDLMKEEAEKDYQLASGIASDVEADDTIFQLTKARLPWLFLGLIGGLGSVFILKDYEIIMSKPELRNLFFYTPLIAAMAGNVGVQSSAIIVQGLANDVVKGSLFSRLIKEVGLSLINGFSLSMILVLFGAIIEQDLIISFTIAGSMMTVIIVAALVGTFIPIILNRRGINPAIATGPFITTCNDIFGIFLFFYIAQLVLGF